MLLFQIGSLSSYQYTSIVDQLRIYSVAEKNIVQGKNIAAYYIVKIKAPDN